MPRDSGGGPPLVTVALTRRRTLKTRQFSPAGSPRPLAPRRFDGLIRVRAGASAPGSGPGGGIKRGSLPRHRLDRPQCCAARAAPYRVRPAAAGTRHASVLPRMQLLANIVVERSTAEEVLRRDKKRSRLAARGPPAPPTQGGAAVCGAPPVKCFRLVSAAVVAGTGVGAGRRANCGRDSIAGGGAGGGGGGGGGAGRGAQGPGRVLTRAAPNDGGALMCLHPAGRRGQTEVVAAGTQRPAPGPFALPEDPGSPGAPAADGAAFAFRSAAATRRWFHLKHFHRKFFEAGAPKGILCARNG
ncbi:potassium/sodium hyperpolarization-activated cyclic nucleotide-gated channel 4-like [Schistocerca cancellata]|uniref:potassium/sodium hyperpolarization-activated cyclic nucleotide-gated channel 4-like n=1 Tax=Schistocerca cancellata TaxID=274614 RepID=UPI002118D707|nr:potassium/sodium hyperpolarization-activated cyclic nucleotide-gated channel 4-like [Schistocerca cancellata]